MVRFQVMSKDKNIEKVECGKCDGSGVIKAYNHIKRGICFACDGKGFYTRLKKSTATLIREAAKKAHKKAYWEYRWEKADIEIKRCTPLVQDVIQVSKDHPSYEMHVSEWARFKKILFGEKSPCPKKSN